MPDAGGAGDWELDRLAGDFPAWKMWRDDSGRLVAEQGGVRLEGPSPAVLRCHLADFEFPSLRAR